MSAIFGNISYSFYLKTKTTHKWSFFLFFCLTASTWVNTTCRDIQTAIIKTCAYNNRSALKLAFGEEYDKLYPGSIYSPPSYNENFSSSED